MYCLLLLVFLEGGSQFQSDVCNGCDDVLMMSMNLSNIAILNIHCVDYRSIDNGIGKN